MRSFLICVFPLLMAPACGGDGGDDGDTGTVTGDDDDPTAGDDDDDTPGDDDDDTPGGDDDDDTSVTDTAPTADTADTAGAVVDTYACEATHTLTTTVLDTSATGTWIHYDLDTGAVVPDSDASWDLRFSTWYVETNGGASGSGGVEVAVIEGIYDAFDDYCQAASSGFAEDSAAGEAFAEWYDYDYTTHELSPADVVYQVKTTDGAYQRLIFDGYYEGKGEAVHTPGFRHGPIEAP